MTGSSGSAASPGRPPREGVDVSIVVTTLDEAKYLPVLLETIRGQETDLIGEVIVVDDGSTDATQAIAGAAGAHVIENGDRGNVSGMRNQGLAEVRGAAVLFADADVAYSVDYIEQMVRPIVDGWADATLCLRQAVLESRFPVLPDSHSASYAWFLRHLPWWSFAKIPIRVLPWMGGWIKRVVRERRLVSPLTIPDRVNTPAIALRTDLARKIGGWRFMFGTHEDTLFCRDVFARTERVLWRTRPVLYVSARRHFPMDNRWIPRLVVSPVLELFGLAGLGERRVMDEKGYKDLRGRR